METPRLIKTLCRDANAKVGLVTYTDMVVFDRGHHLAAIRFGGYSEMVQAMGTALLGGGVISLQGQHSQVLLQCREDGKLYKQISQNGPYAVCTCYLQDDDFHTDEESGKPLERNLYIFGQDEKELYRELDRRLTVPLLPDFQTYFLDALLKRGMLEPLQVHCSCRSFRAWRFTENQEQLISILEDGLKSGAIQIPGALGRNLKFNITTMNQYLQRCNKEIGNRISRSFVPLYQPGTHRSPEIEAVNRYIHTNTGYNLFDTQLDAAESLARQLEKKRLALLVADCGTGKSKIGASALYAHQHRNGFTRRHFNVVLCPPHLVKKWVREIGETVPNSLAVTVHSLSDVDRLYRIYQAEEMDVYCILSKETAKNGYMRQPMVSWSPYHDGFTCPHCGAVQLHTLDQTSYEIHNTAAAYRLENTENHICQSCGGPLWGVCNPDVSTDWVRVAGYGYVHRKFAGCCLADERLKGKTKTAIQAIAQNPQGYYPVAGAYRRYPLSEYIKSHCRIDGLIVDELHNYAGESAQGCAMADLACKAKKIIGMTATLLNGYAQGLFYLLYRLKPALMIENHYEYQDATAFCREYGVVERTYETDKESYLSTSKAKRRLVRERFLPGISPLVYTRYLLEHTVFMSLEDLEKELPDYEEIPCGLDMEPEVSKEYQRLEHELRRIMKSDMRVARRIQSAGLNLLTVYPDQPYGHKPIRNPKDHEIAVEPQNLFGADRVSPKDLKAMDIIDAKVADGGRVIVYTSWTRLDTQDRLKKLLEDKGYRVKILRPSIPTEKREEWIERQVEDGIDVLIVNPACVETGLDLIAFTTLIFYDMSYNLYTFRQASRRSYRVNQTAPLIQVYLLYYKHAIQQRALTLMASKLAAATTIEGRVSMEGLAALSDCQDITTQLARELVSGLKPYEEDLTAAFRRFSKHKNIQMSLEGIQSQTSQKVFDQDETGQMQLFDLLAA